MSLDPHSFRSRLQGIHMAHEHEETGHKRAKQTRVYRSSDCTAMNTEPVQAVPGTQNPWNRFLLSKRLATASERRQPLQLSRGWSSYDFRLNLLQHDSIRLSLLITVSFVLFIFVPPHSFTILDNTEDSLLQQWRGAGRARGAVQILGVGIQGFAVENVWNLEFHFQIFEILWDLWDLRWLRIDAAENFWEWLNLCKELTCKACLVDIRSERCDVLWHVSKPLWISYSTDFLDCSCVLKYFVVCVCSSISSFVFTLASKLSLHCKGLPSLGLGGQASIPSSAKVPAPAEISTPEIPATEIPTTKAWTEKHWLLWLLLSWPSLSWLYI